MKYEVATNGNWQKYYGEKNMKVENCFLRVFRSGKSCPNMGLGINLNTPISCICVYHCAIQSLLAEFSAPVCFSFL
jgi:hypothetical protein